MVGVRGVGMVRWYVVMKVGGALLDTKKDTDARQHFQQPLFDNAHLVLSRDPRVCKQGQWQYMSLARSSKAM